MVSVNWLKVHTNIYLLSFTKWKVSTVSQGIQVSEVKYCDLHAGNVLKVGNELNELNIFLGNVSFLDQLPLLHY